jgi:hypothetical protein
MIDRDRLITQLLAMLADLGWTPPSFRDVIDQILRGELLTLEQSADVAEGSDEKLRKLCELTAETKRPLGIRFAGRWFVGKVRLLDDLEQGKIDRRRGPHVRQRAEERARKYEGWARPQEQLALPQRAAG